MLCRYIVPLRSLCWSLTAQSSIALFVLVAGHAAQLSTIKTFEVLFGIFFLETNMTISLDLGSVLHKQFRLESD